MVVHHRSNDVVIAYCGQTSDSMLSNGLGLGYCQVVGFGLGSHFFQWFSDGLLVKQPLGLLVFWWFSVMQLSSSMVVMIALQF